MSVRDGTVLRVNVFRPPGEGTHPAILCAHPYGKDNLPTPKRGGGFKVTMQYRLLRMPEPVSFSAWTNWEAPDPAHWVSRGYAVVNCDLRGCGSSEGIGDLLSPAESEDYHDLIEWAAAQPDAVWASRAPDLAKVRVAMLVCGSFSDNNLHSRGSIRAFEQVGSKQR